MPLKVKCCYCISVFPAFLLFRTCRKKITVYFLNLNFTAQKDSLPTSSLTPTQLFQQKRALRHRLVQKLLTAKIRGPPVAAVSAASLGSPLPQRRQRHMNMCDLSFQKEENVLGFLFYILKSIMQLPFICYYLHLCSSICGM